MRYKFNANKDEVGDTRIIGRFLLLPKIIDNELRWLEYAYWIQELVSVDISGSIEWWRYENKWINKKWVDLDD